MVVGKLFDRIKIVEKEAILILVLLGIDLACVAAEEIIEWGGTTGRLGQFFSRVLIPGCPVALLLL